MANKSLVLLLTSMKLNQKGFWSLSFVHLSHILIQSSLERSFVFNFKLCSVHSMIISLSFHAVNITATDVGRCQDLHPQLLNSSERQDVDK